MLLVCKADLAEPELEGLGERLAALPCRVRWSRRGGRILAFVSPQPGHEEEVAAAASDPAVDYALREPSPEERGRLLARRDLLDLALVSTAAVVGAAIVGPLAVYLGTPPARAPLADVAVAKAETIPIDGSRSRVLDGEEILIIRTAPDRFHAFSGLCTHSRVCSLGWDPKSHRIVCPCHRGAFDLQGNVVAGPPPRPLPRREIVVRDGTLYVRRSGA